MALTKVSGGILDPGINVAGIVTATGFDGPFTGGSSKNINAGIITATGFDLNGNGDISGNLVIGGNLTANGDFTTLNTTLREVEILRVDANSSEPAGIITQTGAGDLLRLYDGTSQVVTVDDTGNVGLGSAIPSQKLDVVGDTKLQGTVNILDNIVHIGNTNTKFGFPAGDTITFDTAGNERLRIKSTGQILYSSSSGDNQITSKRTNAANGNGNYFFHLLVSNNSDTEVGGLGFHRDTATDDSRFIIKTRNTGGSSQERLRIASNGSVSIGKISNQGKGLEIYQHADAALRIQNSTTGTGANDGILIEAGASQALVYNYESTPLKLGTAGEERLRIEANGDLKVTGNKAIYFGESNDLMVGHDGSSTRIEDAYGYLAIKSNALDLRSYTGSELYAKFTRNGAAELFHNDNLRLATDATGITVSQVGGIPQVAIAQTTSTAYSTNGTVAFVNSTGTTCQINGRTGSASTTGDMLFLVNSNGREGLAILEDGKVRVPDDGKFIAGTGNDLRLYHNSVDSTTHIENFTGDLNIQSNVIRLKRTDAGQTFASFINNGQAEFSFSGNTKLSTSLTGITVTGEVAASQDYPNFRPTVDFNFAAEKKLDPRITYQRTGPASFVNKFGKIVHVGDNVPRFDHDPITRECKGLLIEESRTNIVYNASGASNGTFTENVTNSLTGKNDAFKMVKNSPSGVSQSHINYQISGNGSTTSFVASVFVQKTNHSRYFLQLLSSNVSDNFYVYYNVDDGTTSATDFGSPSNNITSTRSIESYRDNWYRLIVRVEGFAQNTFNGYRVGLGHPTNGAQGYQNTDDELIAYGAQIEVGNFVTSYIPTYGVGAATRGADIALIDGEEFSDFYNPTESTILIDYTHLNGATVSNMGPNARAYRFRAVGGSDTRIDYVSTAAYHPYIAKDGSAVASLSHGSNPVLDGGVNRSAVRVKENSFAVSCNGSAVSGNALDTSGAWPPDNTITEVSLGGSNGDISNQLSGHIQRFVYYPVGVSNSQLVTLTS